MSKKIMNSMIQRKTYTNILLPALYMKLGNEESLSNSSDLKIYFIQNNLDTNEADTTNRKSSFKNIKDKLLFSIFLMMALLVNAQNVEVRAYNDQNFTVKADTFTGSGYATVNGAPTTSQVTQASISTMPSSVSGYAGVNVVVYSQWIGTLPTSAQFDALVEYIRQGGVVIANVEREDPTFREILDRLMGSGHGITKTPAGTTGISPVNFVHPGEGTLKLRSATNTSTPTTTSYSTFSGVPSAARILHGTSNTGCNGTCLDFVVPTFPGVATTLNGQTVRGMLIMSGEVQGPFTGPTGFSTRALAMDQSYAKLIYDFYNSPTAMASRRSWSATSTNQNPICIPETFIEPCNAGSTAPTIGSNKIANSCPTSTGNLTTLVTSTAPSGTSITFHTGFPATTANKISNPTTASTGTYYAAYWDATNNCYSPVSEPIYVAMCLTNTCPSTTVDLTTHTTGTPPPSTTLQWHTSNVPSSGTLVSTPNAVSAGTYYATYFDAANNCYSPVSTPISVTINSCGVDSDGDGLTDNIDLDDDNDGILDSVENYSCDNSTITSASTTTGTGAYKNQLYFFNWTSSVFDNGIQDGDSQSFTLEPGYTITATFSNVSNTTNAATYKPSDMQTWSLAKLKDLYNPAGSREALYGDDGADVSFRVTFTATKNGQPYPLSLLAVDAETTGTAESIQWLTNGGNWTLLEQSGTSIFSGEGTQTLTTTNTDNGTKIHFSENATTIDVIINGGGREAIALGTRLVCDTDGDGIPNSLDLDSDNDGCLDALEGGANITSSQLVNAGGTLTVGSGSTAANQNLCASSTCVDANGVPTIVSGGQSIGESQNAVIKSGCFCYKPAQTTGTTLETNHGITALGRAGADNSNWPMVRKGAWTALEAKTKGFVINRIPTTAQVIAIANPVEGMMVYDEEADCLKIYTTTDNGTTYSWQCFNTQTCPE